MKTRNGFVSNSSTSSFLIAVKGGKLKEKLQKALEIPKKYPLSGFVEEISDTIVSCAGEPITSVKQYLKEIRDEGYGNEEGDEKVLDYLGKGYIIYMGEFSDEGNGTEAFLCNSTLMYESDDLIIDHKGGY